MSLFFSSQKEASKIWNQKKVHVEKAREREKLGE